MAEMPTPIIRIAQPSGPESDEINRPDNGQKFTHVHHAHTHDMHSQGSYGQDPEGQQLSDYKNLGTLLRRCGIQHSDKRRSIRCFWTTPLLQRIMTRERIVEELQMYKDKEPELFDKKVVALADTILSHHYRLFAILVLISKGRSIQAVIDAHVEDKHLPLKNDKLSCHLYNTHREPSNLEPVQCFEQPEWGIVDRESFSQYQYAVDPYVLKLEDDGRSPRHEEFHDMVVLPFTDETERNRGGYGVITKVTVNGDCHNFHALLKSIRTGDCFARKQLINNDAKEFESEADALRRFNGFGNDHMVTLLMTWTLHDSYNLLFPWAECDLDQYWERNKLPIMEAETILWTSKQITGIASAIMSIHNPVSRGLHVKEDNKYGRHGDLKPENILLFDSPDDPMGILVVADLGLAKLNSIVSRSNYSNRQIQCTPKYKSPESDIEGAKITRSYDVWTFGCLILEWVCWLFQGQDNKSYFIYSLGSPNPNGVTTETFFQMKYRENGQYDVVVQPEACKKLAELHADEKCTQYFHDLLQLVEEDMLVVRSNARINSETLHRKLNEMHQRALQDRTYYYTACKTSRRAKTQDPWLVEFKKPVSRPPWSRPP